MSLKRASAHPHFVDDRGDYLARSRHINFPSNFFVMEQRDGGQICKDFDVGLLRSGEESSLPRNCFACLILGAYQVALDRTTRGGDFLPWDLLPTIRHLGGIQMTGPEALLREADDAIRGNLQAKAVAVTQRYGDLGPRPAFDLLIHYAVSKDGALHGEKFYRTVSEEFTSTRPVFRGRHMAALARVTASEFDRRAPGLAEAWDRLKV